MVPTVDSGQPGQGGVIHSVLQSFWLGRKVCFIGQKTIEFAQYVFNELRDLSLPLLRWSIINKHETLAKIFMHVVAHVDRHPNDELTPLQFACSRKMPTVVSGLLSRGADPNLSCIDKDHLTPLFWAVDSADPITINILLDNGANIDGITHEASPLLHALNGGKTEIAKLLLGRKACPDIGEESHYSSNDCVEQCSKTSGLYVFINAHYKLTLEQRKEFCKLLLANQANPNNGLEIVEEKFTTTSPLYEQMQLRSQGKPDPNRKLVDKRITIVTPLFHAICSPLAKEEKDLSLIQLLLENGADPNKGRMEWDEQHPEKNTHRTPLREAVEKNLTGCVRLLLEKGAHPLFKTSENDDPHWTLYIAVKNKNVEVVRLLLTHGADAKTKGQKLLWAAHQNAEIQQLLRSHGADDKGEAPPITWFWS